MRPSEQEACRAHAPAAQPRPGCKQGYRAWYSAVPDDFVFAVKGGRYITHMKRLRDVQPALANFFASGLLCLGHKLGSILWQLPPSFRFDGTRLRRGPKRRAVIRPDLRSWWR